MSRVALVLGGGGPVGIAWECGLLAGLADEGADLRRVDRILGTSAGAIVGAHLAAYGHVNELYAAHGNPLPEMEQRPQFAGMALAWLRSRLHLTLRGRRRSLGRSAQRANLGGEQRWVSWIGGFLPSRDTWPARELVVTAVDAEAGELVTLTRSSGLTPEQAIAASCAVPGIFPVVHAAGRVYMDGGMGSPTNAALARGFPVVVVLDAMARLYRWLSPLPREVRVLRRAGSRVVPLVVDDRVHALIGWNWMDLSRTGEIARAAREQGRREAGRVLEALPPGLL